MSEEDDELAFLLQEAEAVDVANSNGGGKFYEASQEVPESEIEPPLEPDEPIKIGDGQCKICGEPTWRPPGLTKTGRLKRAPIYCDIHDPKMVKERGADFTSPQLESQLRKVQGALSEDVMLFGMALGTFYPVTGQYTVDNADALTTATVQICRNNPRMMRAAHRLAQISPLYQVARFGGGFFTSFQVDQKKADPYSGVAQHLGVSEAYNRVYANSNVNSTPSTGGNFNFNGPPRYATVQ